jgi:large subunit ribosomal protein L22
MQVKASAKFIKTSPKKIRLLTDLVRGLDVDEAIVQLQFSKKDAAMPVSKLIKSAIANAEENDDLKRDNLFISEIKVDDGPTMKRWMPRAMGRATPIRKRSSHITLILDEKVPTEKKDKKKKEDIKDDIIKIEDLGKAESKEKKSDKKASKKEVRGTKEGSSAKGGNKIFNRTGNK